MTLRSTFSMPALAIGPAPDGFPYTITVPGEAPRRRLVLVAGGQRVGWVERNGEVQAAKGLSMVSPGSPAARTLAQMRRGEAGYRVVFYDGEPIAVVAGSRW